MIRQLDGIYIDAFALFSCIKKEPYPFLLEGGMDHENLGRYSMIGWDPYLLIKAWPDRVEVKTFVGTEQSQGDPFDILEGYLKEYKRDERNELPFNGGAVGFFSYDLKNRLEKLPQTAAVDMNVCQMHFGFYDKVLVIDHQEKKTYAATYGVTGDSEGILDAIEKRVMELCQTDVSGLDDEIFKAMKNSEEVHYTSNFTKPEYLEALDSIHEYIRQGDIYQANLTQRFTADLKSSPETLYRILRKVNPAPFASYIPMDEGAIVSSSPERFLKLTDGLMETRPIKGTVPRGSTQEEDEKNKAWLAASEKDRAELLMIVDLERNDLGRVAKTGSVKVTELYKIEAYPTVYHLVSTVQAHLKEDASTVDLVKATFPGGSITGAPKIRAMEIIDELEPTARNVYTGSIGYIDLNGDMDLNIVIRTFVCLDDKAYFQAGGGIVWDSDNEMEYEETFHKAIALMRSIEIANKMGD